MAKRPPSLKTPEIQLSPCLGIPLYHQAHRALRQSILAGEIAEGERLPSSRALAKALRVSRNTVLNAYELLAQEGYVVAEVGSGTRVAARLAHIGDRSLRQIALIPHAGVSVARILEQSRYPLWRAAFQDGDGNALYIYTSRHGI